MAMLRDLSLLRYDTVFIDNLPFYNPENGSNEFLRNLSNGLITNMCFHTRTLRSVSTAGEIFET